MSLTVPDHVLESVRSTGTIQRVAFIEVVRNSLPAAWAIVSTLAERKQAGETGLVQHNPRSMDDGPRGELLRMLSSNAIRGAVEAHFGLSFAFQNCHNVAAFRPDEIGGEAFTKFTSMQAQILNQSPEMRDC
jgi:hypothetical protein